MAAGGKKLRNRMADDAMISTMKTDMGGSGSWESGYALITGASSGIGEAFARALARRGQALILSARSEEKLHSLATELRQGGCEVEVCAADLAHADGAFSLRRRVEEKGWGVSLLINNAGFGSGGDFASLALEDELAMIQLNISSLVELTHWQLQRLRANGGNGQGAGRSGGSQPRGAIINVASVAGFQPVPYMATYASTKAFVLNFSWALWRENRDEGVHVMALCPGTTRTNFFQRAGIQERHFFSLTPEAVVDLCLRGLKRQQPVVITGWANRLSVASQRLARRNWVVNAAAGFVREATLDKTAGVK